MSADRDLLFSARHTMPCESRFDVDGCVRCHRSITQIGGGQPRDGRCANELLNRRIRELEGALCVIEGMAERIVETQKTKAEIKAEIVRVLGVAEGV